MKRRLTAAALTVLCMISLVFYVMPVRAYAEDTQQSIEVTNQFSGEAALVKQSNDRYTFQISVSNDGADFEGAVRFQIMDSSGRSGSAFDNAIALPQGSEKQYMLTIPEDDVSDSRGEVYLSFVDKDGKILQSIKLSKVLGDKAAKFAVGVLSDQFDKLSYMQMPGQNYYVGNTSRDINLLELSASDLTQNLSGLYYLIIDDYDLNALDSKQIQAIEDWVYQGGWLIIGTGSRGESMIAPFSDGFLDLKYISTTEAGKPNEASKAAAKNNGEYAVYSNNGVNLEDMTYSEFTYSGTSGFFSSENPGWCIPAGDGCTMVLGISLTEAQLQSNGENVSYSLYDEVQYNSMKGNNYNDYDNWAYYGTRTMNIIDRENTDVNFTALRVLIVLYAILVGPILYLILRKAKRSEWYWCGIPLLAVLFVGLVYLCGNGMQVRGVRVYSVSVQEADGQENPDLETFMMGYHSGTKEWSMQLKDNYQLAGAAFLQYGGQWQKPPKYTNHVVYKDNAIEIGAKPEGNFDNEYFKAIGTGITIGSIETDHLALTVSAQSGTVTNNTNHVFPFLGLQAEDYTLIIANVKPGETVDIAEAIKNGRAVYNQQSGYIDDVYDSLINFYGNYGSQATEVEDKSAAAALLLGMCDARQKVSMDENTIVVCGVADDCEQYATNAKSEISYSCFYVTARQEETDASN